MILLQHLLIFALHRTVLYSLDYALRLFASRSKPLVPHTQAFDGQSWADILFLCVNSLIEHTFLVWIVMRLLALRVAAISFASVPRVYALLWCDDALYTLLHCWMHTKVAYAWFHGHHHKQKHPVRGYRDAGNEHPIEQCLALSCHVCAFEIVRSLLGIDWTAVALHTSVKAVGSCLNHVGYGVKIRLGLGVEIDTAYHHAHHLKGRQHYAQFIPALDRLVTPFPKKHS